jgi:serine/threonine protein kinase
MLDLQKTSDVEYTVLSTLGRGAFGTTYLAIKKGDSTEKKFVLKVLTVRASNVTDIFQEVDVLRNISSQGCQSGLLCYHDYFVTEYHGSVQVVIVTEAFDNSITLSRFIYSRKMAPLETNDLLNIMHELLQGLYYLHKQKVAHGDIKPDNILINSDLQTQIIDFGLSCRKNCKPGGSLLFSAPEMIRLLGSKKKIQRSFLADTDVFSMGIVFYILANCQFPYTLKSNPYARGDDSVSSNSDSVSSNSDSVSSNSDVDSSIQTLTESSGELFDVKFPNDIIGLDKFWKERGMAVTSHYSKSDVSTNADINKLIQSMLTISTHAKNARPSAKRLLSNLRKIIFNYDLSQKNVDTESP